MQSIPGAPGFVSPWGALASGEARGPVPGSYWVIEGRFAAGAHPGLVSMQGLLASGFDGFVDLTEEPSRHELSGSETVVHLPVPDFTAPDPPLVVAALDAVDGMLGEGRKVYLHCWAGIGRTGTVVGCWLRRHGEGAESVLATLARLRRADPRTSAVASPETVEQRQLVLGWPVGR